MTAITTGSHLGAKPMPSAQQKLKRELRAVKMRKTALALMFIAPLAIFLLLTFVAPIAFLLKRAVDNTEISSSLPMTVEALAHWDRRSLPPDRAYEALAYDLTFAREKNNVGGLARRMNIELSGARSVVLTTARSITLFAEGARPLSAAELKAELIDIDPHWKQLEYWNIIARNSTSYSPFYLLASLDLKQDALGDVVTADEDASIFQAIFARTLWMSLVVTVFSLLLAYPLAYWLSQMPERRANLLMILVLIPFWTSILVRVAAWIVLLQSEGLVNKALISLGVLDAPLELVFNRVGVYISMTHILLPFMVLPLYSVMKAIPPTYLKAAISLGSHPFAAFWRVYLPQSYPGVGAGVMLVFIMAGGYYITPTLLGGPNEQMVSYFIAYFINTTNNWGMACALGSLLLFATLVLYSVYRRLAKVDVNLS